MVHLSLPVEMGLSFCALFASASERGSIPTGRQSVQAAEPAYIYKEVPLGMRVKITLRCNECKQRNYNTKKNKKNTTDRLEMNKYCPFCRKHTVHTETK